MLVNFIGTRGTHPSSGQGTMSFAVDNKIVFDICPEFVQSYIKLIESWTNTTSKSLQKLANLYGTPSFSKIEHIFITHLHYDHWGGLRHFLIWSQMFESSFRETKPINIYLPKGNVELFLQRFKGLFEIPDTQLYNLEDFFLRYLIIEIDSSLAKYVKIHIIEDKDIIKLGKYEIQAYQNKHFRGSLSYKLVLTKYKLQEEKLLKIGLPRGPLISQLQRESEIIFENRKIKVEELFTISRTVLGYSGDTIIDENLLLWFNDCTHLIHETTYFEDGERFHTDSHSSLQEILPILSNYKHLIFFLPVHFSGRYKWTDIEEKIQKMREGSEKLLIQAPKIGSCLHYDEKNHTNTFEELSLLQRY